MNNINHRIAMLELQEKQAAHQLLCIRERRQALEQQLYYATHRVTVLEQLGHDTTACETYNVICDQLIIEGHIPCARLLAEVLGISTSSTYKRLDTLVEYRAIRRSTRYWLELTNVVLDTE